MTMSVSFVVLHALFFELVMARYLSLIAAPFIKTLEYNFCQEL